VKPEIKKQWTKDLRSGKYKQGKSVLRSKDNKYCCLGVLCNIYSEEKGVPWTLGMGDFYGIHASGGAVLPTVIRDWAGIESPCGRYGHNLSLTHLNDHDGKSFEEIADVIDKEF